VFHGEPDEENRRFPEMSWREGLVMAPLLGLIVFLGVYPRPVLDRMAPSVDRLIEHVDENSDFVSPEVDRVRVTDGEAEAESAEAGR
jgi:NADH-quinone oxidoreductase subunit M